MDIFNKMMITGFLRIASLTITLAISLSAAAATETRPLSFPILKLTPYSFFDNKGAPQGYLYEIFVAILEDADQTADVKLVPLKRLIKEFKSDIHDCTLIANSPLAKTLFRIIEPIGKQIRLGILPTANETIDSYENLSSLKIGVPLGVSFDKKFETDDSLTKIVTTDYVESVRMLVHGRLNAVAGNIDGFYFDAKNLGYSPATTFGKPLIIVGLDIVLACNKERPSDEIIQKLRSSLLKLKKNGTIQQIVDKYL